MKVFIIYLVVVVVAVVAGYFLFQSSKTVEENLPGEKIEVLNQIHINEGIIEHEPYNSNPPTSGWHWPASAICAVYDPDPEPDERYIHNLEHGSIWISYKPEVDEQTKAQLKDYVRRYNNVLVTVRPANDSNIALAAWGRLLKLDSYDETRIIEFINAFMDKGPERVACAH